MTKMILAFLSVVGFAVSAAAMDASIIGKWETGVETDSMKYNISLEIFENKSTFGLTCAGGGKSVEVKVPVTTKIENKVFHVLEAAKGGEGDCQINIPVTSFTFEVSEAQLRLNTDDGKVIFLTRAR